MRPKDVRQPLADGYGSSATSLGSSFTDIEEIVQESKAEVAVGQERDVAQVKHLREVLDRQLAEYRTLRMEVEGLEAEQNELKERSKEADRNLAAVWDEAQEAIKKDALFRQAFEKLMSKEDPSIKRTAHYLRNSVPVREELFETLYVTGRTEKHAVENALDLEVDYRRRMRKMLPTRSLLVDKTRDLRHQFDRLQAQKKALYDELLESLEEVEQIDSQLCLFSLASMSNRKE
ncbi:hypothetical protein M3Y99_00722100 [Aphelenchoides fujianensis]|nr:hypothetical protein M3Y99_00722100 [Aphelenchoides fujianensis]